MTEIQQLRADLFRHVSPFSNPDHANNAIDAYASLVAAKAVSDYLENQSKTKENLK